MEKRRFKYIRAAAIDILITDIKMPFMGGIELIKKVREANKGIKIILLSAYGEFEYAREALRFDVVHYILKPVPVNEFLEVMEKVTSLCEEERMNEEKEGKLLAGYEKALTYEKEKVLLDLIQGVTFDEKLKRRMQFSGLNFGSTSICLLMIDFSSKFF